MYCRVLAIAAALATVTCTRQPSRPSFERIAFLRFENLGPDPSSDWMGRAFSEAITAGLSSAPGIYAIPSSRMHGFDRVLGARPISSPGISSERSLALVSGAHRIGYGRYSIRGGALHAELTIEDPQTGKVTKTASATSAAGDVFGAAAALARQISDRAAPYGTRNPQALRAYVAALESAGPAAAAESLGQAIAADPDFGPAYLLLAQSRAEQQDRAGALAALDQALSRGSRIGERERARVELDAATLRGDAAAQQGALAGLVRLSPGDPAVWRSIGESAMNRRQYPQAAGAFQKSLELLPDDATVLNLAGYAAAYTGDREGAMRALRRYQALRPADVNPLDSLGDVNLLAGRLREAEGFYLEAAKRDPGFAGGGERFKAAMARLMSGDVAGADALAKQDQEARAAAQDPVVEYRRAEWLWMSGRRSAGYQALEAFAREAETGRLREAASRAYGEMALWSLMLGDRASAEQMARKAAMATRPGSAAIAMLARFLTEPPAPASEWAARAERTFSGAGQSSIRNLALAYALLLDKQFQPASALLRQSYDSAPATGEEGLPVLLAWAHLESGHERDAAPLLRLNPIPPIGGVGPLTSFYFPRIYYLRGVAAQQEGKRDEARANFRLFLQLSGPDPFMWGEEKSAQEALR